MISRRTAHLARWSLLLPLGFLGMLASEIYRRHELAKQMPGWKLDATTPWYFDCFGYVFFLGCFLAFIALLSFLRDRFTRIDGAK
jgi:hypothetical protein